MRQYFERNVTPQFDILGEINFPHTAFSNMGTHFVVPKTSAREQRLRRTINQSIRFYCISRRLDEIAGLLMMLKHRLQFSKQFFVAVAGIGDEGIPLTGLTLQRQMK